MAGLHSPKTPSPCTHGRATLVTGPYVEQSVGLRPGSPGSTSVMTEQAFTLAMGDLRLDVGHEERSAKELPNLAYEHESLGLIPIIECFRYTQ
eukprot:2561754-Pleurochrysis_carterae.AAC.1